MEEDIKKIEYFLNQADEYYDGNIDIKDCVITTEVAEAIENLIKGYKELQERDEERKQRITHLENKICNQKERLRNGVNVVNLNANRMCEVFDLIPKSKVREKIEELEKEYEEYKDSQEWEIFDETKYAYELLQELLEERN